MSLEM
jgi:hypothetical protein